MLYHLGKADVDVDTLSRKTEINTVMLSTEFLADEFVNLHPQPIGWSFIYGAIVGLDLIDHI